MSSADFRTIGSLELDGLGPPPSAPAGAAHAVDQGLSSTATDVAPAVPTSGISPALSTYLDGLRLVAALVVFVHHASYARHGGGWLAPVGGFGHEAVVVFFVLSGFVIAHTVRSKDESFRAFGSSRLSRLWSVALPAIVVTLLFDAIGSALSPRLYAGHLDPAGNWLASALFTNEFWARHLHVGSNLPFWSLSYEAAYYLLFALFMFARRRWLWIAAAALVIGPAILLLAPAWIAGVVAYRHAQQSRSLVANGCMAGIGATVALWLAIGKVGNLYVTWRWITWLGTDAANGMGNGLAFVSDNLMAVALAVHLVGVAGLIRTIDLPAPLRRAVAAASLCTFPIYLFHYPALYFFTAISDVLLDVREGPLIALAALVFSALLTQSCERLRRGLRRWLDQGFTALGRVRPFS